MIQIFIFIIILIVFFAITSWKFAPYAFVALIMLAVHNTSDLCFIADNKLATTIFLMLVFLELSGYFYPTDRLAWLFILPQH